MIACNWLSRLSAFAISRDSMRMMRPRRSFTTKRVNTCNVDRSAPTQTAAIAMTKVSSA